jgi:phage terminase Nu1 subunit (DNA packaging protein)
VNDEQLCIFLKIDAKRLAKWRREGLPFRGRGKQRSYDVQEVYTWIIENGHGEPVQKAKTIREVAAHFHVSERIVYQWQGREMPGRDDDGTFDLGAIDQWARDNGMGPYARAGIGGGNGSNGNGQSSATSKAEADARVSHERADKLAMENAVRRGELVLLDPMLDRVRRRLNEVRAIVNQLPDKLGVKVVELGLPPEHMGAVVVDCRAVIDEAWQACADLCEREDADERAIGTEPEPEAEGE